MDAWSRLCVVIALAFGLLASQPALAQPAPARAAPAPADERQQLGEQMAHVIFAALDLRALISKAAAETSELEDFGAIRPEWTGFLRDAVIEEIDHDLPAIERILGKAFAGVFTVEELRVGVKIMSDSSFQRFLAAEAAGKETADVKPSREIERLTRTRTGVTFLEKMEHIDDIMSSVETEMFAELLPGVFRRFGEKAEAAETRRAAGPR
ncbi:MAG: hypothetical protein Q8L23_13065 [Caulobacter sp.]|nr:hypothetical protein [Caulobacter sp.]